MNKKNDKKLCWNCDGDVSLHSSQCPYCGVDLSQALPVGENLSFSSLASPFQSAPTGSAVPKPPYSNVFSNDFSVTEEEWKKALEGEKEEVQGAEEENVARSSNRDMIALLLLLPGIVFSLFGLALTLFSQEGLLTLQWNQNLAYFYFVGAVPLLYLGWRAFRSK